MSTVTHDQVTDPTTEGVEDPPSLGGRRAELARVTAGCEGTQAGSIHRLMLEQVAHLVPTAEWRELMAWAKVYVDLWGDLPDPASANRGAQS